MDLFSKEIYIERRKSLHSKISGGIGLIPGNSNEPYNYRANIYRFRQDSTFLYYFGINHPGYIALMDFNDGQDYIFADDITLDDIIWMGEQTTVRELSEQIGIRNVFPLQKLNEFLSNKFKNQEVKTIPQYRPQNIIQLSNILDCHPSNLEKYYSNELIRAIVEMRLIKSMEEIEYIEHIMDVAYAMHTTAMKMASDGIIEREIAGAMEGIALANGGYVSFPIILSKHGEILHNENHDNILKNGDLLLVDAGFDSPMGYATDHTRTFPVGGVFSTKQIDIYNIVLNANNTIHNSASPGKKFSDMHFLACKTIALGLKELGLMKGDPVEAVIAGAHALFMPHGLGHAMGLDVHDMENLGENIVGYEQGQERSSQFGTAYLRFARTLQPGHVVTNEPGIYFIPALIKKWKAENLFPDFIDYSKVVEYINFGGVRLEDDILITDSGCRNLGKKRIPITAEELSQYIGKL